MKKIVKIFIDINKFLLPSYIVLFILIFIVRPFTISGTSMYPSFNDGDKILIQRISYYIESPERYDIVVINSEKIQKKIIKRIIALPGETIQITDSGIYVNGNKLQEEMEFDTMMDYGIAKNPILLGQDEYFVLGDNRNGSIDSRHPSIGKVSKSNIIGKYFVSIPL